MKIKDIIQDGDFFTVVYVPNKFEKIFGIKPTTKIFKKLKRQYEHSDAGVYVNKDGQIIGFFNKMTEILDNHQRKF